MIRRKRDYSSSPHDGLLYAAEELDFLRAIERLKFNVGPRPTDQQIFRLAIDMGYRKVAEPIRPIRHLQKAHRRSA